LINEFYLSVFVAHFKLLATFSATYRVCHLLTASIALVLSLF